MPIFNISNSKLAPIKELRFNLEKDIQNITEHNIETIFGYHFISTEVQLNDLRIDTLAFNSETKSFVIIEYKKDRSFSVIDQGYAYLSLVLNNKADFILEYNESQKDTLKRDDVDWSQTRVLFIAPSFTVHQRNAINFKDLPIELWEVKKYDNQTILYNELQSPDSSESIKTVSKSSTIQKVSKEVKVYSVSDHFTLYKAVTLPLYETLRDKLFNMEPGLQENPRRGYIGMSLGDKGTDTIVYIHPQVNKLRLDIPRTKPKDIKDPLKKVRYKEGSLEHWNTPVSVMYVASEEDADYAITILRQVREKIASN